MSERVTLYPYNDGLDAYLDDITGGHLVFVDHHEQEQYSLPPAALPALRALLGVDAASVLERMASEMEYEQHPLAQSTVAGFVCQLRREAARLRGAK